MGMDVLDPAFRLERHFGVRVSMDQLRKTGIKNDPPDIRVGELFDRVRGQVPRPEFSISTWTPISSGRFFSLTFLTRWASSYGKSRKTSGSYMISELSDSRNA